MLFNISKNALEDTPKFLSRRVFILSTLRPPDLYHATAYNHARPIWAHAYLSRIVHKTLSRPCLPLLTA